MFVQKQNRCKRPAINVAVVCRAAGRPAMAIPADRNHDGDPREVPLF